MNQKKAKRIRQLVRHLMSAGKVEENEWLKYGREMKYVERTIPDSNSPVVFDEEGKLVVTTKKITVATGSRMMDPGCGRAIYQAMKKRTETGRPHEDHNRPM